MQRIVIQRWASYPLKHGGPRLNAQKRSWLVSSLKENPVHVH
jgi:hypothetical protein